MPDRYFAEQPSAAEIERIKEGLGAWFEIDLDALLANLEAICITLILPECKVDVPSFWHARRERHHTD